MLLINPESNYSVQQVPEVKLASLRRNLLLVVSESVPDFLSLFPCWKKRTEQLHSIT
jgi:hypothetical protein